MTKKEFITVLVITFIVFMIWLAADIYFNTKPSVSPNPEQQSLLEELSPDFNSKILDQIGSLPLPENDTTPISSSPSPTPKSSIPPLPSPIAPPVPSPSQTASPVSTSSAGVR